MVSRVSLFVYGSFSEGMVHFDKLSKYITSCRPGSVLGRAYRLRVGYPVVLIGGNQKVSGALLQLDAPDVLFNILDEFHGYSALKPEKSLFLKEKVSVELDSGEIEESLIYGINPQKLPKTAALIEDGDWEKSLKETPVVTENLSEKQVCYIKKTGSFFGARYYPH